MTKLCLRSPVYRVYGTTWPTEDEVFAGIWFRWPVYRKHAFNVTAKMREDFTYFAKQALGMKIVWPDVTPRDPIGYYPQWRDVWTGDPLPKLDDDSSVEHLGPSDA